MFSHCAQMQIHLGGKSRNINSKLPCESFLKFCSVRRPSVENASYPLWIVTCNGKYTVIVFYSWWKSTSSKKWFLNSSHRCDDRVAPPVSVRDTTAVISGESKVNARLQFEKPCLNLQQLQQLGLQLTHPDVLFACRPQWTAPCSGFTLAQQWLGWHPLCLYFWFLRRQGHGSRCFCALSSAWRNTWASSDVHESRDVKKM